ncbi:MAG: hypothetical protein JSR31_09775 [Nitrospira sp.]|nr:hypothetical protein [Nitrospira sp.]
MTQAVHATKVMAMLTIHPADGHGDRRWELDHGAILYDVTRLACRSARYTPAMVGGSCSPTNAKQSAFPVVPGGTMPPVEGCTKQDYLVWKTELQWCTDGLSGVFDK